MEQGTLRRPLFFFGRFGSCACRFMRPRERALIHGVQTLDDAELLALLIGSGAPGEGAEDAGGAALLADLQGDLHALGRCGVAR